MMNNTLIAIKYIVLFTHLIFMTQLTTANNRFPRIITETHNQTLNISSTAILTCHVRDLGDHHVTWFKTNPSTTISSPLAAGEQLFTADKRYSISFYSTSVKDSFWSLEIYQVNLADEGTYICKIANRKASVSIYIHLHIQIPMIIHPTYVHAEPNTNIILNCRLLINNEYVDKRDVTWIFLSHQLNKTKFHDVHIRKRLSGDSLTADLVINHTQMNHTGTWACIYRQQLLSVKVLVQKNMLTHQRASALLSNDSYRKISSIYVLLFLVLFIVDEH
ncbi:unnamed protein product [Rotaria socialis]|uniref:Ig-like domain-containing protein n=1 Tax=Rotaria socialis TaxID=392032 RepID=A0A820UDB2_9BILA|nr:unnamed protein product [Rotaria socialis]CAF3366563.1 unnamed protein product [Rotaria socialis]CAF3400063.1 unnamed protein product [Rotaria socialis]CAF3419033.1 unnamed protein product [Rotaria socialis]CAF3622423.1 unnamed protein product [Rotaria socialis]